MAEVDLGRLADIAQSGGTQTSASGKRSGCRNPECRQGLTPGLVAIGGGTKGAPLYGAGGVGAKRLMRWAWVRCLACNPPDDARKAGASYRPLRLTEEQMAQRAEMATAKTPYTPVQDQLGRLSLKGRQGSVGTAPPSDSGQLAELRKQNAFLSEQLKGMRDQMAEQTKLMAQNNDTVGRMSAQVMALLDDNNKLRKELEGKKTP